MLSEPIWNYLECFDIQYTSHFCFLQNFSGGQYEIALKNDPAQILKSPDSPLSHQDRRSDIFSSAKLERSISYQFSVLY